MEGGANRGIFTAGVLDYLMEKDVWADYVIGVSAGACNAVDYVSRQIYRSKDSIIAWNQETGRQMWENFRKNHTIMDMDLLFDTFPNKDIPFDYDTYFDSNIKCEMVVTNARTGKAEYWQEKCDRSQLMRICRASSSLPILSKPVQLREGSDPYFDGGLADSIPVHRALELGYRKIIVVLTQQADYRKGTSKQSVAMMKARYRQYPALAHTYELRADRYNHTLDQIKKWEDKGKLFVIRPEIETVKRLEKDISKLDSFYHHGYDLMGRRYDELKSYLNLDQNASKDF